VSSGLTLPIGIPRGTELANKAFACVHVGPIGAVDVATTCTLDLVRELKMIRACHAAMTAAALAVAVDAPNLYAGALPGAPKRIDSFRRH
jgi:hypothetical protein